MLEADLATEEQNTGESQEEKGAAVGKSERRSRTGFNKRLLKNANGEEQSFEEARAVAKCYRIAPPSINFNLLHIEKADQSSQMDLDDEASIDVSMTDSPQGSEASSSSKQPRKVQRLHSKTEGRVLFRTEASFDASLNQTAISTASSTVHELDAVGLPTKKEEETINTKFAMRELSMMFSSPAFGVEDIAQKTERASRVDQSVDEGQNDADVSYNVGDMLGTSMLDNSILNTDGVVDENRGPRNPFARTTSTPGFESMALREVEGESDTSGSRLDCSSQLHRSSHHLSQQNPLRGPEIEMSDDPGFRIYEDEANAGESSKGLAFSVYEDGVDEDGDKNDNAHDCGERIKIYEDERDEAQQSERPARSGGPGFNIYVEGDDDKRNEVGGRPTSGLGFSIFEDDGQDDADTPATPSHQSGEDENLAHGDTASFSLFGDAVAILDNGVPTSDNRRRSNSLRGSNRNSSGSGGDTATVSVFNEVFKDMSKSDKAPSGQGGGFQIFEDPEDEDHQVS